MSISASNAFFIKLGRRGIWEQDCLRDGILRLGFREVPHEWCVEPDWPRVREGLVAAGKTATVAGRFFTQLRSFYGSDENTVFITFVGGLMHWCQPYGAVEPLPDGTRRRRTVDGWRSTSIGGHRLSVERLSGHLLRIQMFQGALARVRDLEYLLRKLNDEISPEVQRAVRAEQELVDANTHLMRRLTWQDFELLVDLIFAQSGWRRIGRVGGSQKTFDLELVLPSTGRRAFVQVKSEANAAALTDYAERLEGAEAYDEMLFAWHTGSLSELDGPPNVILLGPEKLSRMVVDAGLSSWLREKVS